MSVSIEITFKKHKGLPHEFYHNFFNCWFAISMVNANVKRSAYKSEDTFRGPMLEDI